jgi:hypothetical protein
MLIDLLATIIFDCQSTDPHVVSRGIAKVVTVRFDTEKPNEPAQPYAKQGGTRP